MRGFGILSTCGVGIMDWDKPYGQIIGPHKASYEQDGKFFDRAGYEIRVGETSKTLLFHGKRLEPYLKGEGIDIGCGRDPVADNVQTFDLDNGDAERITEFVDRKFNFVFSSHCLEHLDNPSRVLMEWWSLVRNGGYLILIVPDEDLYEQGVWPSRFSSGHRYTFTIHKDKSWSPVSINLAGMLEKLGGDIILLERQDDGYDYEMEASDQTAMIDNRLAQIIAVVRKSAKEGRADALLDNGN